MSKDNKSDFGVSILVTTVSKIRSGRYGQYAIIDISHSNPLSNRRGLGVCITGYQVVS